MAQTRRRCRLADITHRNVDLRQYEQLIIDTINETVPNKNPKVYRDSFSTDQLTQGEAVRLGRALYKIPELNQYGKQITTYRLFEGYKTSDKKGIEKTKTEKKRKGGRVQ